MMALGSAGIWTTVIVAAGLKPAVSTYWRLKQSVTVPCNNCVPFSVPLRGSMRVHWVAGSI